MHSSMMGDGHARVRECKLQSAYENVLPLKAKVVRLLREISNCLTPVNSFVISELNF